MTMERKLFTAELQRLKAQKGEPAFSQAGGQASNDDILRMLSEIKGELQILGRTGFIAPGVGMSGAEPLAQPAYISAPAHASLMPTIETEIAQKQEELTMVRTEMRALAVCIQQTKSEIAALRPTGTENDRLMVVTTELDAIVQATEGATESILEAAEKLDGLGRELRSCATEDGYVTRIADEISDTIVNIYEACNFQDITGQRISKVVRTLDFIEQRILAMINIWGHDAIAEIETEAHVDHASEEAKLLNGPQLSENATSQEEIDKLFG